MLRRALALGGGLLVLILLVLGVKGCLDARADRALSDYAEDVSQIVEETDQTSKAFFDKLSDPGALSVTEFIDQVNADRSAMDNYAARIDGLDAPGDVGNAQDALELSYALRASAMNEIADKMPTALGDEGSEKAITGITRQMQKLLGADVLYAAVVRPEINNVLADKGISGNDVPESVFLPEGTKWLEEDAVSSAIESVSGGGAASDGAIHGLGSAASASTAPRSAKKRRRSRPKKPPKSKSKSKTRAKRPRTGSALRSRPAAPNCPNRSKKSAPAKLRW